jgi:protocatechuate 3,4-dioxygenase beta subunit
MKPSTPFDSPLTRGDRPVEIDQDDRQVGRMLSRREILALLGVGSTAAILAACVPGGAASSDATSAGATSSAATGLATASAIVAASALPACVVRPAETEGPFFVDERLERSDIRSDPSDGSVRQGTLLRITFAAAKVTGNSCGPYAGLLVDVWHCDALGVYSDVADPTIGTSGRKFLRGYQVTDASGLATFTTIYPGWYEGRTVHIHFKIRADAGASSGLEFTSQLFFDDTLSDRVYAAPPYAQKGQRTVRNDGDGIYATGGDQLLLDCSGDANSGYSATFPIGLQVS